MSWVQLPDKETSKDSRVVKGAGLKTLCVSFVGSTPTPCKLMYDKNSKTFYTFEIEMYKNIIILYI